MTKTAHDAEAIHYKDFTKQQKVTMLSTTAGFSLEHMDHSLIPIATTAIVASLGVTQAAAGLITTFAMTGTLLGGLFFGMLADKIGRARIFNWTIFVVAFATAALYFADNIYEIYFLKFIAGFGTAAEYGAGVTLIAESFAGKKIGRLTSLAHIGGQTGTILAAIASAVILPKYGWNALCLFGLLPIAFAFFVRRNLKDSAEFEEARRKRDLEKKQQQLPIIEVFKTPALAYQTTALVLMMMVQIGGYYGILTWLPKTMQAHLGLPVGKSTLWTVAMVIGMSLGMYFFGSFLDKFGPRKAFGLFLSFSALALYLPTFANNALSLLIIMLIVGFFSNGMYAGFGVIVSRLYPAEARVTANSVVSSGGKFLGGFFPAIVGVLMDKFSFTYVLLFFTLSYLFSLIIMLTIPALRRKDVQF
ncbi:MFS family (AraJ) [Fructobacillus fructosus]|uniref:MFS transporter n=1 Tax=Fructobacillus fructosus TaxID=1631 RepID=UPI00021955C9|nr:MFS transporter [Fructobacillus fructosus]KRN52918.1 major facilitator superfamily permease [Fructobacillus fructosus KCTC 3544]MCK8638901.1 MFS transporter [Fructobacillus fructosus]CAK1247198.1 MFS family (AraJ) [Fructobacillus fructosus]CAK1248819.1 MFS family (AraJ) [Fructobacillus fructosus]GAP00984.1 transporter, major facilitator family protein [Fructobacillus fructosus]